MPRPQPKRLHTEPVELLPKKFDNRKQQRAAYKATLWRLSFTTGIPCTKLKSKDKTVLSAIMAAYPPARRGPKSVFGEAKRLAIKADRLSNLKTRFEKPAGK